MKIEKIDNNKIRCFLSSDDLSERQIELTELAYGTEKATMLFREMLEEASEEFGLDFEDSPIMVEAIPVAHDSIILIISKVDDPEELDTRFSRFAPGPEDIDQPGDLTSLIPRILEGIENDDTSSGEVMHETIHEESDNDSVRIFKFKSIDEISDSAKVLTLPDNLQSSLFFDPSDNGYYLVIFIGELQKENYVRICNSLSEFGVRVYGNAATAAYYEEHLECIIKENALSKCRSL